MSEGTIKERLTRIETVQEHHTQLLANHIHHHDERDKWMLRIFGGFITGFILMVLPGFVRWLGTIL